MSTKISELTALSGGIPATNAVPISVSGTTYKVNLGDLAELNGSADVKTALGAANKAALATAVVDGTAINPISIGATTQGTGKFTALTLGEVSLEHEAHIVAKASDGSVQARLAFLDGYYCWVFRNASSGYSNIYAAGAYVQDVLITGAHVGYGVGFYGTYLACDAINILAAANGDNPQKFRIYGARTGSKYLQFEHDGTNAKISTTAGHIAFEDVVTFAASGGMNVNGTYTSSTNFERLTSKYDSGSGAFVIGTEKGSGGGSARPLRFYVDGIHAMTFSTSGNTTVVGLFDAAGITGSYYVESPILRTTALTVATLTAAATAGAGSRSFVTDSNAAASGNFGAVVAGGGSNKVPVYSDGRDWRIG